MFAYNKSHIMVNLIKLEYKCLISKKEYWIKAHMCLGVCSLKMLQWNVKLTKYLERC